MPAAPAGVKPIAASAPVGVYRPARKSGTVLVVDDEEDVREVVQDMLEHVGYAVLTADGGRQAVQILREHVADVDVVLLDMTMPDMDGRDTFGELRRIRKDLPIVLCSGYSIENVHDRFDKADLPGFLQKPFLLAGLVAALSQAMNPAGQERVREATSPQQGAQARS